MSDRCSNRAETVADIAVMITTLLKLLPRMMMIMTIITIMCHLLTYKIDVSCSSIRPHFQLFFLSLHIDPTMHNVLGLSFPFYGRPIGQAIILCSCSFFFFLWPPCVADADIIFYLPLLLLLSSFFLACSQRSQIGCHTFRHMV